MQPHIYKVRLDRHSSSFFYPYCSEILYNGLLKNYALKEEEVVEIVIKHLNAKALAIELVSQTPIEDNTSLTNFQTNWVPTLITKRQKPH